MKSSPTKKAEDAGYYAPYDVISPSAHKPSAPLTEMHISAAQPVKHHDGHIQTPLAVPEPLPPSPNIKRGFLCMTLKLFVYHFLNAALGIGAFCVVVTGVPLSVGLVPLCCVGVVVYLVLLRCVRVMAILDIMLANYITQSQALIVWNVPDELEAETSPVYHLRIAPQLNKVSIRSTVAIVYFASVKFAFGIISCVVACLPFLPIASEIVSQTANTRDTYVAGFPVHEFNLDTHPVLYVLASIGYIVVGVFLMHFFGRVSRETTRRVVCKEIVPTAVAMAV